MTKTSQKARCKHCGAEIAADAKVCPQCGGKNKKPLFQKWWFWTLIVIVAIGAIGSNGPKKNTAPSQTETDRANENLKPSNKPSEPELQENQIQSQFSSTPDSEEQPTPQKSTEQESDDSILSQPNGTKEKDEQPEKEEISVDTSAPQQDDGAPMEHRTALIKAESYSELMHMSKAGIYDQLTSEYGEKYSPEAAQYAIDNMDTDWNANALAKGQDYSDTMHMSKAGIYDQLISEYGEKFTADEAQYAVENIEANWNENALEKAKEYQTIMAMSPSAIYDQLISEYGEKFTAEEAQYAIEHLN